MLCLQHIWHGVNHKRSVIGEQIVLFNSNKIRSNKALTEQAILIKFAIFQPNWLHKINSNNFNRLRLADILVRPMQRLTKYNLLLAAIRKHITDEIVAEIMDSMVSHMTICKTNMIRDKIHLKEDNIKSNLLSVRMWIDKNLQQFYSNTDINFPAMPLHGIIF